MTTRRLLDLLLLTVITLALMLGLVVGYRIGRATAEDEAFHRGYCAGLDIADTSCGATP